MTQEIIIQPSIKLTGVAINPTLNKEQNIFMSTGANTEIAGGSPMEPVKVAVTPAAGKSGGVSAVPVEVLQAFVSDKLTKESLAVHRELERAESGRAVDPEIKSAPKEKAKPLREDVIANASLDSLDPAALIRSKELADKESLSEPELRELLDANSGRISKAEELLKESLGRELTDAEKKAILKAHYVGLGEKGKDEEQQSGVFNVSEAQLLEKARILKEAGFDKEQRREIIESGVAAVLSPIEERNQIIENMRGMRFTGDIAIIRDRILRLHDTARRMGDPNGIPAEDLEREFRKYEETISSATRGPGGAPRAVDQLRFSEILRQIHLADNRRARESGPQGEFVTEYDRLTHQMDEALRNYDPTAGVIQQQRSELVSNFVGDINPSTTTFGDDVLMRIIPDEVQLRRLAFRIVGQPLGSETSNYSLGFYSGINLDGITNLLQTLSENERLIPDPLTRRKREVQLADIYTLKDGIHFVHELNRNLVGNNLEGASQYADFLIPEYQDRLQRLSPLIASVQRALESQYGYVLSRDGWINVDNYAEMMGVARNSKTGEVEVAQDSSVYADIQYQLNMAQKDYGGTHLVENDLAGLTGMKPWEIKMAYSVGRNLFNISHRGAEWISQGAFPPGNSQYESPPGEAFARIMNFGREIILRFDVGKNRGGIRWFSMVMDAMQRSRKREGYGLIGAKKEGGHKELGIEKIRGDDIKLFELPTMTGVRGWWASWRAGGGILRTVDARYDARGSMAGVGVFHKESRAGSDKAASPSSTPSANTIEIKPTTQLGLLLDTGALQFEVDGKRVEWGDVPDQMRADYYASIFLEPGTHGHPQLRKDLNIGLGVAYKLALAPSGGHALHEYHKFNHIKEEIRALIWKQAAQDNPLAIAPYLHRLKYKNGPEVDIYTGVGGVDWQVFQRKLTFFNELRLSNIRGLKRPDGSVVNAPKPEYTLKDAIDEVRRITGGADFDVNLTPQEEAMLAHIRAEGVKAAPELANVRYAFIPFLNDVTFETADYGKPGAMSMKRHYNDLGQFHSSNNALGGQADNLGLMKSHHDVVKFISEFAKGITGVHGDEYAKDKAYPIVEATIAFFRRGENGGGKDYVPEADRSIKSKATRYFRQWDEFHGVLQALHKANSIAQQYYNVEALAIDRHQTYMAMEELEAGGVMGHQEANEYKRRFGGFLGFIARMMLEGFLRTGKLSTLITGRGILGSSFKGAIE